MEIFPSMTLGAVMMMCPANHSLQKRMRRRWTTTNLFPTPGQGQSPNLQSHHDLEAKALHHLPEQVQAQDLALVPVLDHLEVKTLAARRTQNLGQGLQTVREARGKPTRKASGAALVLPVDHHSPVLILDPDLTNMATSGRDTERHTWFMMLMTHIIQCILRAFTTTHHLWGFVQQSSVV